MPHAVEEGSRKGDTNHDLLNLCAKIVRDLNHGPQHSSESLMDVHKASSTLNLLNVRRTCNFEILQNNDGQSSHWGDSGRRPIACQMVPAKILPKPGRQ
jgi:hypothetical protein